ncbi:hypothetical protein CAOG_04867 [Capsaspora owczarzaki ATCC 30864]|uniref:FHF complex subunit HOOK-interacting protein C-terminal domain-containing protein n=1 Tax=Capsaspora owczarzaki (strain ATCC 30864) TaxID=595528 RepID=A0A0D2UGI9_CAPO3|nr:hypothetical protein CAOG_04867 [Capsaspora owczarzaki ATCC 30864]KJE94186.1 hypothetical protein CAOG_004867 [Capsaspora owczarzaki ATCC 30864]|eukprot:XP_004347618.2 hypothetical protein CAOG_04867 [Capsaspora owczarzaki ATCC 30864]
MDNVKSFFNKLKASATNTPVKGGGGGGGGGMMGGSSPASSPGRGALSPSSAQLRTGGGGSALLSPSSSHGQRPEWWMDSKQIVQQGVHDSSRRVQLLTGHWESLESCIKAHVGTDRVHDLDRLPIRNNLVSIVNILTEEDRELRDPPYVCFELFIEQRMFEIISPDHVCKCFKQLRGELAKAISMLLQILQNNSLLQHETTTDAINILLADSQANKDCISPSSLLDLLHSLTSSIGKHPAYLAHFLKDSPSRSQGQSNSVSQSNSFGNLTNLSPYAVGGSSGETPFSGRPSYEQLEDGFGAVISAPSSPSPPPIHTPSKRNRDPFATRECTILALLTTNIHEMQSMIGDKARAAMLPLLQVSHSQPALSRAIVDSFCPFLAAGLSAYYSPLPTELPVPLTDWIALTQSRSLSTSAVSSAQLQKYQQQLQLQLQNQQPGRQVSRSVLSMQDLDNLVHSLDFCNQVASRATADVARALAQAMCDIFFNCVLGPALYHTTKEERVASFTYFEQCVAEVSDPRLLRVFIEFVLGFEQEDKPLRSNLFRFLSRDACEEEMIAGLRLVHTMLLTFRADAFGGLLLQDVVNSEVGAQLRSYEAKQATLAQQQRVEQQTLLHLDSLSSNDHGRSTDDQQRQLIKEAEHHMARAQLNQWRDSMEEFGRSAAAFLMLHPYALDDVSPDHSGYESYVEQARLLMERALASFPTSIAWSSDVYLAPLSTISGPLPRVEQVLGEGASLLMGSTPAAASTNAREPISYRAVNVCGGTAVSRPRERSAEPFYPPPSSVAARSKPGQLQQNEPPIPQQADLSTLAFMGVPRHAGAGPLLNSLFDLLENMTTQSYSVNLLLTAVLSQLAVAPVPWLRQYMINTELPLAPGTRSLFRSLTIAAGSIRKGAAELEQFAERLSSAKAHLAATSMSPPKPNVPSVATVTPKNSPMKPSSVASPAAAAAAAATSHVRHTPSGKLVPSLSQLTLEQRQQFTSIALAFTCESTEVRTFLLAVIVFEEFVKELSAIAQELCLDTMF